MNLHKWTVVIAALITLVSCGGYSSDQTVKIYKDDEKVQCESYSVPLSEPATELTSQGIDVLCSHKGNDGEPNDSACGEDEGSINIYVIFFENEQDAINLGFNKVSTLPEYVDLECN